MKQTLTECHKAQLFFSMRLIAELFHLMECFASEQIDILVVKGPVLAAQAYGNAAVRSYGDLDVLVRQGDIHRAMAVMMAANYKSRIPLRAVAAGRNPGQYLFYQPNENLIVELHSEHTLRYFPRQLPLQKCFERQIRVRIDAREVPALSVEDELVLICIHGAKHFWERLMWIADVAWLVSRQTEIDWERTVQTAAEVGAERMLNLGLRLAADLLKMPLPSRILAMVRSDVVAAQLVEQILPWLPAAGHASPSLFDRALFRMRMRGGHISGPFYLLRLSLSPTEEDWKDGPEVGQSGFLDALGRPFRLARKYGRNSKS